MFPGVSLGALDTDFVVLAGSFGIPGAGSASRWRWENALAWSFKEEGPGARGLPLAYRI